MARSVTLLKCLAASLLAGGHTVVSASTRPPSITHQNPYAHDSIDPLADYAKLRDNATTEVEVGGALAPVSRRHDMASIFKQRQVEEPGEGALLCPTGKCPDDSCCGPQGICGYGPDFCGAGCQNDCDAKAMCGIYSDGGNVSCGLDLCCSWGGWCGTATDHCVGPNQWSLCQEGFGKCEVIRPTEYGPDSGTATNGRTIGYYQSWNTRNKACHRVWPSQIKKEQYTHLYFAFASIDPVTFHITPAHSADVALMTEFTALKGPNLQTWIAVGGYDFSDNGTATHTTWSDLCQTAARRAAFIESVRTFMDTYGFQGVDLDWEYPVDDKRGGRPEDVVNFVSLLREMRAAYGTSYGISLTLAPDYWYLRWFDAKGLEPYVDHMGFMAYDLHGYWDQDVLALGSIVRGQADVREIYNNSIPLAYAELDFSKLDFGVAWYGRGYTLQDPSCNTLGCPFIGPSRPAKCTNAAGVMSLDEIRDLIAERGLQPRLLQGAMMKEIVWDDQWIGYDDEETVAMKKAFANNLGFGGTMAWSVDFNAGASDDPPVSTDGSCGPANGAAVCEGSGFGDCCSANGWCGSTPAHCGSGCLSGKCIQGGVTTDGSCGAGANNAVCGDWPAGDCCSPTGWCGSTPDHCGVGCQSGSCIDRDNVVFIDPRVYESRTAKCQPPCTLVLPPVPLEGTTTLTMTPFTTSLEVGSSVGGTFVVTTTTITVVMQDIVTHLLPQSNVVITNGQTAARFNPTPSIVIPPSTVTVTNGLGQTSARLVVFPPWPQDDAWNIGTGPFISESSMPPDNDTSVTRLTLPPVTLTEEPHTEPPVVLPCTANYGQYYISEHDAFITLSECSAGAATSMVLNCPPTKTVAIEAETTKSFSLGCTLFTGTGPRITSGPLPTYTTWPDGELILEDDSDDDDSDSEEEFKSGCNLWFFNICWPGAKLGALRWKFPEGVLPPGPPPFIRWPKNVTPTGTLPGPWPPVTIPWDRKPIIPTSKAGQCTTRTADICSTTTTLDITTIDGTSTKTSTRTQSTCTTIRGCKVEDDDWETTTTTSCARSTITTDLIMGGNKARAQPTSSPEDGTDNVKLNHRQDDSPGCRVTTAGDVMIFPKNPTNAAAHVALRNYLMSNPEPADNFWEAHGDRGTVVFSASNGDGSEPFYGLYLVHGLDRRHYDEMWNRRDILGIAHMFSIRDRNVMILPPASPHAQRSESARDTRNTTLPLMARDEGTRNEFATRFWELSIMAVPPKQSWEANLDDGLYRYQAHDSFGGGQVIYLVEEDMWTDHEEFDGVLIDKSSIQVPYLGAHHVVDPDLTHGTQVAAKLVGKNLGLARKAQLILSPFVPARAPADRLDTIHEGILMSLIGVLNHVMRHPEKRGKQIVNVSWDITSPGALPRAEYDMMHRVLKKLESLDVVIVVSTHNDYLEEDVKNSVDDLFMRWANPRDSGYIEGVIAVSGINQNTWISPLNPWAPWIALAPGYKVGTTADPPSTDRYKRVSGASVAAPLVAGTIAYWRGQLDDSSARAASLRNPANVKKLVFHMHRPVSLLPDENGISAIINVKPEDDEPQDEEEWRAFDPTRSWNYRRPFLWSGEMNGAGNCVAEPWLHGCPGSLLDDDFSKLAPFRSDSGSCAAPGSASLKAKRQAAAVPYCSVVLNPPHQPSGPRATSVLTYTPGPASPTCLSSCGTYCSGFYCRENPTGHPPAFFDPEDPAHQPTATTSPGRAPTPPPELPPLPPGPTCSGNQYPTTTMVCNGGGGNLACLGSLICATSTSTPTSTTAPPGSTEPPDLPDVTDCPRSMSTATVCFGFGGRTNCATSLVCPSATPTPPSDPGPTPDPLPPPTDYLAILESVLERYQPGVRFGKTCDDGASLFEIRRFANGHIPKASSGVTCPDIGERIAASEVDNGETLNGCHQGGYTDGYQVCEVEDGAHIYRPDGKWMLCERDNSILRHCYLMCWQTYTRHMKCDGIWRT